MEQFKSVIWILTQSELPTVTKDEEKVDFPILERWGGVKNQP